MSAPNWIGGIHAVAAVLDNDPTAVLELMVAREARNPRLGGEQRIEAFEKLMAELGLAYPKFIDYAVPGNRACGECPGGVPEDLREYCEQIGESLQG